MRLSFVVVLPGAEGRSSGGEAQMRAARDSLHAAAGPGDEVIVVDAPPRGAAGWLAPDLLPDTERVPVLPARPDPGPQGAPDAPGGTPDDVLSWRVLRLGTRGPVPHAVAANVGLAQARGDAVMVLSGTDMLHPAGIAAARAALARQGGGLVLGLGGQRGAGSVTRLDALRARPPAHTMLMHRDLLHPPAHAAGPEARPLRLQEAAADPRALLVWRACLLAPVIGLVPLPLADPADGAAPLCTTPALFDDYRRRCALLPGRGVDAAALQTLARAEILPGLGRRLLEDDPESFWPLAEAARPVARSAPAQDWLAAGAALAGQPEEYLHDRLATGARAMVQLATQPLFVAVALWQGDALWRRDSAQASGGASMGASMGGGCSNADPQQIASTAARALWHQLRHPGRS